MGRRRKAWLPNGTGRRIDTRTGKTHPGYYVQWHDYTLVGKRVLHSRHFHKQNHAREFCRRFNAKTDLRAIDEIVPVTIKQASTEFFPGLSTRSAETVRQYGTAIVLLIESIGDINVCDIGRAEIDRFIADRMAVSSEATVAKHVRGLKRFFRWCVKGGYAAEDPIELATSLPRNGIVREKPRITAKQFRALVKALDTEDRKLAVQIAATTGLDRGVITRITPTDVDLERRQFNLVRFKVGRHVYPHIHDDLIPTISERLDRLEPTVPLLQGLSHQGGLKDWWRRAVTGAGVPDLKFVDLRTYAANWLRDILGDFEAQKILGHSTPAVTAKHYYQQNPAAQRLISKQPLPGNPARRRKAKTSKADTPSPAR